MRRLLPVPVLAFSLACSGLLGPQTFESTDGRFALTVPAGFERNDDLHEQALLGLQQSFPEAYVLLIADERVDTVDDISFEERSLNVRNQTTDGFDEVTVSEPVSLEIGGFPALQMRFEGKFEGLDLGYIQTTVLTEHAFVQVVVWAMADKARDDAELAAIASSLVELGPMEPAFMQALYGDAPVKAYRTTEDTRLSIGGDWRRGDLAENPDASLLLEHATLDLNLMVITEPIEGSEISDLPTFRQLVVGTIGENMGATRFETDDPVEMPVDGMEGLLTPMDMDLLGYRFAGLHLSLQSASRYHQVWIWGPHSQMERHDTELRAALASFEELQAQ